MWNVQRDNPGGAGVQRLRFANNDGNISYDGFLRALADSATFRDVFMEALRAAPYIAFRWETPPLTQSNTGQQFECLLHDSPGLDVPADPTDFKTYFQPGVDAVSFPNLGSDALLVVPCPVVNSANYSHIAAFHRSAPASQQHALWISVVHAVRARLGLDPLWLNTAGGGVDWLHIRLDDRPTYYRHQPWKKHPR